MKASATAAVTQIVAADVRVKAKLGVATTVTVQSAGRKGSWVGWR